MSDLSIPSQAVEWARAWISEEALGPLATVRRSPGSARRRIERAVVELSSDPVQAKRCARSISSLRGVLAALAAGLALTIAGSADAKPRKHKPSSYMTTCIHERTGPVGGVSVREARAICAAEDPSSDDEVEYTKGQLTLARLNAKVAKAKARARKAIEACEQAITDRCVELADPVNGSDCNIEQGLRAEFVAICLPEVK